MKLKGQILDVVDGDTLRIYIDHGFGIWSEQLVHLRDVDAPELIGVQWEPGEKARDDLFALISSRSAGACLVSMPVKKVRGEWFCDVWLNAPDEIDLDLGKFMIESGLARRVST